MHDFKFVLDFYFFLFFWSETSFSYGKWYDSVISVKMDLDVCVYA